MDLFEASQKGNLSVLTQLLTDNPSLIDHRDDNLYSIFHWAAYFDEVCVFLTFFRDPKHLYLCTYRGSTPLHIAVEQNSLRVLKFILSFIESNPKHQNLLEIPNQWNETPLHLAASNGSKDVLITLVQFGASLLSKDSWGRTPIRVFFETHSSSANTLLLELQNHVSDISILTADKHLISSEEVLVSSTPRPSLSPVITEFMSRNQYLQQQSNSPSVPIVLVKGMFGASLETLTGQRQSPENPQSLSPENPQSQSPENPQSLSPENPQSLSPENPQSQSPENPQSQSAENPQSLSPENPQSQSPENPQSQSPENPQSQSPEKQTPNISSCPPRPSLGFLSSLTTVSLKPSSSTSSSPSSSSSSSPSSQSHSPQISTSHSTPPLRLPSLSQRVEFPGDPCLVRTLLHAQPPCIDPRGRDFFGLSALHKFASWDKVDLLDLLLEKEGPFPPLSSEDLNALSGSKKERFTALHFCVDMGASRAMSRLLREDQIDPSVPDHLGRSPLQFLREKEVQCGGQIISPDARRMLEDRSSGSPSTHP